MSFNLSSLPAGALAALVVLAVVAITLDVIALRDLYRRPTSQVAFANQWIWVAVILLVNILGAIIYLVAGRRPAVLTDDAAPSQSTSVRTDNIADTLYGPRDGADPR
jgi:multisubunit Na+/H+ antiporter MnhB subunit